MPLDVLLLKLKNELFILGRHPIGSNCERQIFFCWVFIIFDGFASMGLILVFLGFEMIAHNWRLHANN